MAIPADPIDDAAGDTDPVPPGARNAGVPGVGGQPGVGTRRHSRTGAAWVALIVAAVVFVFLLVFIMQNSGPVDISYFGFEGAMSLGVAMTLAAVLGALTAGLLGTVRILQLRSRARRERAQR